MRRWTFLGMGVVAVALCAAVPVRADWIPGQGAMIIRIDVSSDLGRGVKQFVFTPDKTPDGSWQWQLPPGQENRLVKAGDAVLASIDTLAQTVAGDPAVSLAFAVVAGAADTTFTITSAPVSFAPIVNPLAFATAAVTVTDLNGDGATLSGLQTGGKAYKASYNSPIVDWAFLVSAVTAPVNSSNIGTERRPTPSGRETILATVGSIESQFSFTLTARDSASGTSTFDVIIPEPASLLVLGVGCVGLLARRRSR